ncbi:MAG: hypothetical protein IH934_05685 [Nanoarchaeota archaeon]|nr:hypothetical protein [Nanoarchaeota archaeon]
MDLHRVFKPFYFIYAIVVKYIFDSPDFFLALKLVTTFYNQQKQAL